MIPAAFTAQPADMQSWKTIGAAIYSGQNPYTLPAYGLVYPPLWGFICSIAYAIFTQTQNPFVFNLTIKLPIIAADIAIAGTIETIILSKTKDQKIARGAMILYLFNPVAIILSSLWGMFDSIPVFLVLLSMLFLTRKQYAKSSLALGVGIAFKGLYPALLVPLFLYIVAKTEVEKRQPLKYLALSAVVPVVTSIPFIMADAIAYVSRTIHHYVERHLSNLTYWLAVRLVLPQNQDIVSTISFVTFVVAFPTVYIYILRKADAGMTAKTMTQVILAFFLVSTTVNEQYVIWLLPPMIIYTMTIKQKTKIFVYAITTIATIYAIANNGTSFLTPVSPQIIQIQHLLPVMIVCSILFPAVSAIALRETMKEEKTRADTVGQKRWDAKKCISNKETESKEARDARIYTRQCTRTAP